MRIAKAGGIGIAVLAAALASCSSSSSSSQHADAALGAGGADGGLDAGAFDVSIDGPRPQPGTVRMAVPAYFYPGADWQRLIAGAPVVGMIVFNPASGPGTARDPSLSQGALSGDAAKAKKAFQDFFELWKDADPDLPILQQAKAEYAELR